MKHILVLALIFFVPLNKLSSQEIADFITGINPTHMATSGNDLYYVDSNNKIMKIDLTASIPVAVEVLTNVKAKGIVIDGDDLYFNTKIVSASGTTGKLCKIDITETTPTVKDIITGLTGLGILYLNGNDMYMGRWDFNEIGKFELIRVDITGDPSQTPIVISEDTRAYNIAINGNDLYVSDSDKDRLKKIDLNGTLPADGVDIFNDLHRPISLTLKGNEMFVTQYIPGIGGEISKFDITDSSPFRLPLISADPKLGLPPIDLIFHSGDLYISIFSKLLKTKLLPTSVSTQDDLKNNKNLYPNPANDFITISGLQKKESYKINNLFGAQILNGNVSNNEQININKLVDGLYILNFSDGTSFEFIKN